MHTYGSLLLFSQCHKSQGRNRQNLVFIKMEQSPDDTLVRPKPKTTHRPLLCTIKEL